MELLADIKRSRFYQAASCLMLCVIVSSHSKEPLISQLGQWKRSWPGGVYDANVFDGRAYLCSNGLEVYDITDPTELTRLGKNSEIASLYKVIISSDYAYGFSLEGLESSTLWVMDVRENNPKVLGLVKIPRPTQGMAISRNHAYLASGVFIYAINITDPTAPYIEGEVRVGSVAKRTRLRRTRARGKRKRQSILPLEWKDKG